MQALDLNDPEKFVMADIVTKNSKTGITSNKRLLVIKKGHLYYYSSVPKNFKNEIKFLESYHELPKCSIEILNIKKINGFETNSNYFSIEFQARHMMEREDIRKTMTLEEFNFAPKNKKETITWQFTCDSQNIKQKWVSTLQSLHSFYSKEKINIQKFFDNINKKEEEKQQVNQPAIRSSLKVPWREDQIKKSSSNESLNKNLRNSQLNRSPSPSNEKKSVTSNSNSQKNQPKQTNRLKLFSPESEEDLVQTFMKIQKTKSVQEKKQSISIEQQNEDVSETPRHSNLQKSESKPQQEPEPIKNHENFFNFKQPAEPETFKETNQEGSLYLSASNQIVPDTYIIEEKLPESPKKQAEQLEMFLKAEPKKPSMPKIEPVLVDPKPVPNIRKRRSIEERNPLLAKPLTIQYKIDGSSNFYELLYFSENRQYSFDKRIEAQKKLNSLVGGFTDKCVKSYMEFINSKGHSSGISRFSEEKINEQVSTLEIGYVRYKIGYVTTQTVSINGKQKIFYNQSAVKQIKRQMAIYNKLFSLISQSIKSMNKTNPLNTQASLSLSMSRAQSYSQEEVEPTHPLNYSDIVYPPHLRISINQLRVPLCTYVQYKGICAMGFDETHRNKETEIGDQEKLNQWKDLLRILGFNSGCFEFRTIQTNVGDLVVIYLSSAGKDVYLTNKQEKHHNVSFQSPMNVEFLKKARKEGASTSSQSLLRYIKGIETIKDSEIFTCPREEILTTLEYCYLLKHLRKFYRASQAEIDELKFVNLLLKGDSNMDRLFQTSSFEYRSRKANNVLHGIFFEFLLYYLGIDCQVNTEICTQFASLAQIGVTGRQPNTSRLNCVKEVKLVPRVIGYCLDGLQLYESFSKVDYYIACKSNELASKALELKEGAFFENEFQLRSYPWPSSTQCLFALAELNYIQNDYISSIAKCKQFLCTMLSTSDEDEPNQSGWGPAPSCCIPIYFLMIKCYSKFSRQKFNQCLKQALSSAVYNYGEHSSMVITLFSFVALVFCGIGEYSQAETYLKVAIKQAETIYRLYSKSKMSQLYLDLSRVLLQQNKNAESELYLSMAESIVESKGNEDEKINLLLYILETALKVPKSIEWEQRAIQTLYRASKMLKKQERNSVLVKQYYSLQYQIGIKYKKGQIYEEALEQLWKLDSSSKILAIEYCYRLIGHKFDSANNQSILERWSLPKEKSLLLIQENVKNYHNLMDMMSEVLTEEDEELASAFLKLLPDELVVLRPN